MARTHRMGSGVAPQCTPCVQAAPAQISQHQPQSHRPVAEPLLPSRPCSKLFPTHAFGLVLSVQYAPARSLFRPLSLCILAQHGLGQGSGTQVAHPLHPPLLRVANTSHSVPGHLLAFTAQSGRIGVKCSVTAPLIAVAHRLRLPRLFPLGPSRPKWKKACTKMEIRRAGSQVNCGGVAGSSLLG